MFCSVLIRRLKEGTSFEGFLKTWEAESERFGRMVQVVPARRIDDAWEILSFSFLDAELRRTAEGKKRRHDRLAEVKRANGRGLHLRDDLRDRTFIALSTLGEPQPSPHLHRGLFTAPRP